MKKTKKTLNEKEMFPKIIFFTHTCIWTYFLKPE